MKKKKSTRRWSDYLLFLIIAVIVFFTPNALAFVKLNYFSNWLSIRQLAVIEIESDVPISAFAIDDGIACSADDQINVYSYDGKMNYQRQLFGKRTIVRAAGEHVVVVDLERGEIAKFDTALQLIDKKRDIGPIVDAITTKSGDVICQLRDDNTIVVFGADLQERARIAVQTDRLIKMSISDDQATILVTAVAIEDLTFKSYVLHYDLTGKPVATSELEDELVFNAYLMNNQVIVTQSTITSYNRDSRKVAEIVNMDKIDQTTSYQQELYITYSERGDGAEQPYLAVYSDDLEERHKLKLNALPERIVVNQKFVVTYGAGQLYVYDHELKFLNSIQTNRNVSAIQWLDAAHLMVYDQNQIDVYILE